MNKWKAGGKGGEIKRRDIFFFPDRIPAYNIRDATEHEHALARIIELDLIS